MEQKERSNRYQENISLNEKALDFIHNEALFNGVLQKLRKPKNKKYYRGTYKNIIIEQYLNNKNMPIKTILTLKNNKQIVIEYQ